MPRPQPSKPSAALVLTEAQRISERPVSLRRVNTTSLEERIAELEAAVSARSDEWEPDGSEDQELHRPRRIIYTRPPTEEEKSGRKSTLRLSQIALIETGPANDDEEANAAAKPVAFRHDAVEEPELSTPSTSDEDVHVSAVAEVVAQSVAEMAENALQDDDAFNAALADAVKRSIAAEAEDEVAQATGDAVEPEPEPEPEPEELEEPEEPQEPEAVAAPETRRSDVPVSEPENIAAPAVASIAADQIDVEHLRPLVSALIREELQGELGERITRNVRKLVRREINRALSGREFE